MPHDLNGNLLQVGDKVLIPATIKSIDAGEEYCNCTVTPDVPMYPSGTHFDSTFNTSQLIKDESQERNIRYQDEGHGWRQIH